MTSTPKRLRFEPRQPPAGTRESAGQETARVKVSTFANSNNYCIIATVLNMISMLLIFVIIGH